MTQTKSKRRTRASDETDPIVVIDNLLKVVEMLMPGLAHIAVQDYALINEAPIAAHRLLEKQHAADEGSMRRQYDRRGLIQILRAAGINMPFTARVYVNVPGGGDYSNCLLDLTEGVTVTISTKPYDQKR